jgi:hypothetical protein
MRVPRVSPLQVALLSKPDPLPIPQVTAPTLARTESDEIVLKAMLKRVWATIRETPDSVLIPGDRNSERLRASLFGPGSYRYPEILCRWMIS